MAVAKTRARTHSHRHNDATVAVQAFLSLSGCLGLQQFCGFWDNGRANLAVLDDCIRMFMAGCQKSYPT